MVKIGSGLVRKAEPVPAPAPPVPAPRREPAAPRAPPRPKVPDHVREAFSLIYTSNQPRYERSRAKGMLFALETVKSFLDELK